MTRDMSKPDPAGQGSYIVEEHDGWQLWYVGPQKNYFVCRNNAGKTFAELGEAQFFLYCTVGRTFLYMCGDAMDDVPASVCMWPDGRLKAWCKYKGKRWSR